MNDKPNPEMVDISTLPVDMQLLWKARRAYDILDMTPLGVFIAEVVRFGIIGAANVPGQRERVEKFIDHAIELMNGAMADNPTNAETKEALIKLLQMSASALLDDAPELSEGVTLSMQAGQA